MATAVKVLFARIFTAKTKLFPLVAIVEARTSREHSIQTCSHKCLFILRIPFLKVWEDVSVPGMAYNYRVKVPNNEDESSY